jgi:hypothetical protein
MIDLSLIFVLISIVIAVVVALEAVQQQQRYEQLKLDA